MLSCSWQSLLLADGEGSWKPDAESCGWVHLQTTTGLYIFWAVYVVVVGALAVNYFRGNKEWL